MVIECSFGMLKARFGSLRRDMDINLNDLTHVIQACFILHNICEIRNESISQQEVEATMKYDKEFQPSRQSGCVYLCVFISFHRKGFSCLKKTINVMPEIRPAMLR